MGALAVVGMDCRFPGAPDLAGFWDLLTRSGDGTGEVPEQRWNARDFYAPDGAPAPIGRGTAPPESGSADCTARARNTPCGVARSATSLGSSIVIASLVLDVTVVDPLKPEPAPVRRNPRALGHGLAVRLLPRLQDLHGPQYDVS